MAEYAPWFPPAPDRGADVPPEEAGRLTVRLANLRDARLSGRAFSVGADIDHIASEAATIVAEDFYTRRLRKPRPFESDSESFNQRPLDAHPPVIF